jgi:hypothetical protein
VRTPEAFPHTGLERYKFEKLDDKAAGKLARVHASLGSKATRCKFEGNFCSFQSGSQGGWWVSAGKVGRLGAHFDNVESIFVGHGIRRGARQA